MEPLRKLEILSWVRKFISLTNPVRVLSRNPSKAKKMFGDSIEIIEGDLLIALQAQEIPELAQVLMFVLIVRSCKTAKSTNR